MPTAPCSTPDARLGPVEQVDGDDDDEDGEGTAEEACSTTKETTSHTPWLSETAATPSRTSADQAPLAGQHGDPLVAGDPGQSCRDEAARRRRTRTPTRRRPRPTSSAATNGPIITLSESSSPRTTLTEVSSSGVRHSDGISAEWLARYGVKAIVETTASA